MKKVVTLEDALKDIKDGATIMIGGFLVNGTPHKLINYLVERNLKDITLISNDTATEELAHGRLVKNKQIKKLYASHIGTNKETGKQMYDGTMEVTLIPQGTLIEQIRAGGFGLGGVLTKTGIGTLVEDDKQIVEVDGEKYLLEKPFKADFSLIFADTADEHGNLKYKGSENNFNHLMATASKVTIVEARHIVKEGDMDPNNVDTPGMFIDYVVKGGEH
ncbi:CoA transferase subunit A [Amphibacillus sp. Q70]|uniref:CoA transferase subunit A n=1 Tax=Amphibacillus sp. Q70 TaxID=3453416 RepID=UPI003F83F959